MDYKLRNGGQAGPPQLSLRCAIHHPELSGLIQPLFLVHDFGVLNPVIWLDSARWFFGLGRVQWP